MLSLSIRDVGELYSAYMPFIRHGGLFIPTQRHYQLGDEIMMLLHLMDENERIPVVGNVIWITPRQAESQRAQGVGIQFDEQESKALKARIVCYLIDSIDMQRPTQTL